MASSSILLFQLSLLAVIAAATAAAEDKLSAYEALQTFNFPMGILPKGALGYELNEENGDFKAFLNGSCSFSLEGSYQLKYKSTISGLISKNKLTNLTGVSVKIFLLSLNIVEVNRNGDELEFSVGIASTNFLVDNFEECPQCGCGLNCANHGGNDQVRMINDDIRYFLSSI